MAIALAILAGQPGGRLRPPDSIECSRDKLTSFTGVVRQWSRAPKRIRLRVDTDEETRERFELLIKKGEDITRRFLIRGGKFGQESWKEIEAAPGKLRPGVRATVWVCEGGSNPVVDFHPPAR
jgi:hypothetical protein